MSKQSKQRFCPAVGREITSAECGENRISKYSCPPDCPFNTFAPANYLPFLDLDDAVCLKCVDRARQDSANPRAFQEALGRALDRSPLEVVNFTAREIFFRRDAAGLTCADRWERAGFPGLKNDERVLVRAKKQIRIALLEVRRILDLETTEAVDLLDAQPTPMIIKDRVLAKAAPRFGIYLAWIFPLPHYWRFFGVAMSLPDMPPLEPTEVVCETVKHLGGPTGAGEIRLWLAEHLETFNASLDATSQVRRQRMFDNIDAKFGKAVYEALAPAQEIIATLTAAGGLMEEDPRPQEKKEGFTRAWAWRDPQPAHPTLANQDAVAILGRVLAGPTHWRLETMGSQKLARCRALFESTLGRRVKFTGERIDDLMARLRKDDPHVNLALVPPRLLENPSQIVLSTSLMPVPIAPGPPEQMKAALIARQNQTFLDQPLPGLDNQTPRQAVRDPVLRTQLVRLMKDRVRRQDEENLRTGRADDMNWMLQELELSEILFPLPPPRPRFDPNQDDED
jgi:hypothetical protein